MNNLNERILKSYKDNIAISKLKEECIMKRNMVKKVTTFSLMGIILVFGSFFTVNAATGGELIDNFKTGILKVIKIKYVDADEIDTSNFTDVDYNVIASGEMRTGAIVDYKVVGSGEVSTKTVTYEFDGGIDEGNAAVYIIEEE